MSDTINQTEFTENAPTQSEPVTPQIQTPPDLPTANVKRSKSALIFVVAGVFIIILVLVGALTYSKSQTSTVDVTPTPSASEAPVETKGIRDEIAPFLKIIEQSNPEEDDHPFPPVNFDVRIKDPNSR